MGMAPVSYTHLVRKVAVKGYLGIGQQRSGALRDIAHDGGVFIAAGPHGILPVGIHEHRRYQHEALYALSLIHICLRLSREQLRAAVVMSEILAKPVALRGRKRVY